MQYRAWKKYLTRVFSKLIHMYVKTIKIAAKIGAENNLSEILTNKKKKGWVQWNKIKRKEKIDPIYLKNFSNVIIQVFNARVNKSAYQPLYIDTFRGRFFSVCHPLCSPLSTRIFASSITFKLTMAFVNSSFRSRCRFSFLFFFFTSARCGGRWRWLMSRSARLQMWNRSFIVGESAGHAG